MLMNISIFALFVDKQAHWLQIMFPAVLNTRSLGTQVVGIANRQRACPLQIVKLVLISFPPQQWTLITYVVVVVVWFGDPCESPGALLLKAAPGYVVFTA